MKQDLDTPTVGAPQEPLAYRLITGPDDAEFCRRVSQFIEQGYVPYGAPTLVVHEGQVIAGQALLFSGDDETEGCCAEGCCS